MSAVAILRALLLARSQVTDKVPPARVFVGAMTLGTPLPAIAVSDVDGNEVRTVARNGSHSTIRARIQVTVYARTYAEQEAVLLACKLPGVPRGLVTAGSGAAQKIYKVNAVEPMGTGPAIPPADDGIFERSRDFMVTFKEAN